jgi:hypothetical protein
MIPGAFEVRARRGPDLHADAVKPAATVARTDVGDAGRLSRELEGGGAPSERRGLRGRGIFERLWRRLMRPTDKAFRDNLPERPATSTALHDE